MKKPPIDIIILDICTINDNHMMYDSWDMEHDRHNFLSFWTVFCPFTSVWTQKNFETMKKPLGDIITLHMSTVNDNQMMYDSWDMECDGQNFLSFWTAFCPFTPLVTQKIKILKKWKNHLEIISFYTCVP